MLLLISLPAILLVIARAGSRRRALLAGVTWLAVAGLASVALSGLRSRPSEPLVVLAAAASVAVLVRARSRWESERDTLRRSAFTDPLTGIANRRHMLSRIRYEIARHARSGRSFALVMVDLDGFKRVNDRFGHLTGDDLLRDVGYALERTIRAQDTAARIGGDEFCVLAPETDGPGLQRLVGRVLEAVGGVTTGVESLHASAGLAVFPGDGTTPDELLDAADQRLIAARRRQRAPGQTRRAA